MNMNLKNVAAIIGISAITTVASMWAYGKISKSNSSFETDGKLPANYASFFNGNAPATTVDFTPAANAASPAGCTSKQRPMRSKYNKADNQDKETHSSIFLVTRIC